MKAKTSTLRSQDALTTAYMAIMAKAKNISFKTGKPVEEIEDIISSRYAHLLAEWDSKDLTAEGLSALLYKQTMLSVYSLAKSKKARECPLPTLFDIEEQSASLSTDLLLEAQACLEGQATQFDILGSDKTLIVALALRYSYEEIAQMQGIPLGTVKSRVNRMRQKYNG